MRLCDRDIEAWLDEGRLSISPRPPIERINGATVDVRLGNKFRTFRGHTAPFIDLSFNSGKLPLALRPGMPIGALSFEPLSGPAARPYNRREDAKYRDQQGAVASRIDKD